MKAKVVAAFKDKEHQHVYRIGDEYPAEGFVTDEERIELLAKPHPQTKKVYLFVEKKEEAPVITEPKKKTTPRKKSTTEVGE